MSAGQRRIFHILLYFLGAISALFIIYQITSVSRFNAAQHASVGLADQEETYADIHFREGDTSSWIKRDVGLYGKTFDAALYNHSGNLVSEWTLRVNITGDCYLNQFWNGETEIHQHVASGKEKVQTLNLAHYDKDSITLDYTINDSDLMIPLEKGDYVIYHPSEALGEVPVEKGKEVVVGFILYFKEDIDLTDYRLDYYYKMGMMQGPLFPVICALLVLLCLLLGVYLTLSYAYRKAENDMELRKSGIACMAELYAAIYIIDLQADSITPVGMSEEADERRPKDLPANEQLKNLIDMDIVPEFRNLVQIFADLETIPDRMSKRNSLAVECKSERHGWIRLRFIAMEREEGHRLKKVLFTIQQINEEKEELDAARRQSEKDRSDNEERKAYLDGVYREAQNPVRRILRDNNDILSYTQDETVRGYASSIKKTAEEFLVLIDNTLDVSYLDSGKMMLTPEVYDLQKVIDYAQRTVQVSLEGKDIELTVDVSRSVPERLYGDGMKLRRILISLLTRVIGDLDAGAVRLRIFGKREDQETIHLLVSVQGDGAHIGDAQAEIGMRLVEGLVTLMGSELKTADLGKGRDFYFEIDQKIPGSDIEDTISGKEEDS